MPFTAAAATKTMKTAQKTPKSTATPGSKEIHGGPHSVSDFKSIPPKSGRSPSNGSA